MSLAEHEGPGNDAIVADAVALEPADDHDGPADAREAWPAPAPSLAGRIARAPIALRLTAAFALSMALLLGVVLAIVYARQAHALDRAIDHDLRLRANEVVARASDRSDAAMARLLLRSSDGSLQVYDATGATLVSTPRYDHHRLVTVRQLRAHGSADWLTTRTVPGINDDKGHVRVLVRAVPGSTLRVAFASTLSSRTETLEALLGQLTLAFIAALIAGSVVAWSLARRALLPVERLRAQAAAMALVDANELLAVPPANDEIARLATTLNELLRRLHGAVERERRFVADAGHELRTPLTLLSVEIEHALDMPREAEGYRETLTSLREETDRLARLAENLLFLATDHAAAAQAQSEVALVATRVADRVRPLLRNEGRELVVDVPGGVGVACDPDALQQLLLNLVDNSMSHGSGTVTITCTLPAPGDVVVLSVRDEGGGVPADFASRAFERFARADRSRAGRGTGLGLSIVATIARACGGEASVVGGHVRVELPRED